MEAMIRVWLEDGTTKTLDGYDELEASLSKHLVVELIDYSDEEITWCEQTLGLDFSIMTENQEAEISAHYLENDEQAAFHFTVPYFDKDSILVEEPLFFFLKNDALYIFSKSGPDEFFKNVYREKLYKLHDCTEIDDIIMAHFAFVGDYYADITEYLTKRIKTLANRLLIKKEFTSDDMDIITRNSFNNLTVKEALIEAVRTFSLFKRGGGERKEKLAAAIEEEISDLYAVSDYIQFNFDRLGDLKGNVSNKVDLEQNNIFKILTVVTVCISLPTFIAGVFGMNFEHMPELHNKYGYPVSIVAMILAAILPYYYFKKKKWV